MKKKELDDLRRRAEEKLAQGNETFADNFYGDLREALHELHTYQIELELQNDELRKVQAELVESRDQYIDLYDFAPIGYLTVSDKKYIVEANLTLAELLGDEKKSLIGKPFSKYIFPEDQDVFYFNFRKLMASPDGRSFTLRMLRKKTGWFWAKLDCVPGKENDRRGHSIRIALNDITEAKRHEAELIKVNKLEATAVLAGGIAHDFNNLLAVILGNLDIAEQDINLGRTSVSKLQNAYQATLRAAELTKKFLTFSGGGEPFKKPVSIQKFIVDTVNLALAGANMDFDCTFQKDLRPTVMIDASQMALAIGNVLNNARESMPQGGMIQIVTENADSVPGHKPELEKEREVRYVKVSIHDQGSAIPEEILPRVFDPYFSTKQICSQKGMGMGLTVAYSILKKHGGTVDVKSRKHHGTTVSLYLPVCGERSVLEVS